MCRTQVETEIRKGFRAGRAGAFSYFIAETVERDSGVGGAVQSERGAGQTPASVPQLNDRNE